MRLVIDDPIRLVITFSVARRRADTRKVMTGHVLLTNARKGTVWFDYVNYEIWGFSESYILKLSTCVLFMFNKACGNDTYSWRWFDLLLLLLLYDMWSQKYYNRYRYIFYVSVHESKNLLIKGVRTILLFVYDYFKIWLRYFRKFCLQFFERFSAIELLKKSLFI